MSAVAFDPSAFRAALLKAAADLKANRPLAARPALSGAQIAAALTAAQARLPAAIAFFNQNPGVITAADDLLGALEAAGVSWAEIVQEILDAAPGALAKAEDLIPWIAPFLSATFSGGYPDLAAEEQSTNFKDR